MTQSDEIKYYLLEKNLRQISNGNFSKRKIGSKIIGYYTILGVFFAAFFVIEPLVLEKELFILLSSKEILAIINYLSMFAFFSLVFNVYRNFT